MPKKQMGLPYINHNIARTSLLIKITPDSHIIMNRCEYMYVCTYTSHPIMLLIDEYVIAGGYSHYYTRKFS